MTAKKVNTVMAKPPTVAHTPKVASAPKVDKRIKSINDCGSTGFLVETDDHTFIVQEYEHIAQVLAELP